MKTVMNGWPESKQKLNSDLSPYWNIRDDINISDGLLLKGEKSITPLSLRPEMLKRIHLSHMGIKKSLSRARELLYWPGMSQKIKDLVEQCEFCNRYRNKQTKPLLHHKVPNRPWQKVTTDLFYMNGDSYLILVDYFSKFFEVSMLQDAKSLTVMKCLRQNFARHGIPVEPISYNGPEYSSYELLAFAKDFGFKHIISSPRYPQSNGLAERTIQTAKKLL